MRPWQHQEVGVMDIWDISGVNPEDLTQYVQELVTVLLTITGTVVPASVIVHGAGYGQGGVSQSQLRFWELDPILKLWCNGEISFNEMKNQVFLSKPFHCRTAAITRNGGRVSEHRHQAGGHGQRGEQTWRTKSNTFVLELRRDFCRDLMISFEFLTTQSKYELNESNSVLITFS